MNVATYGMGAFGARLLARLPGLEWSDDIFLSTIPAFLPGYYRTWFINPLFSVSPLVFADVPALKPNFPYGYVVEPD